MRISGLSKSKTILLLAGIALAAGLAAAEALARIFLENRYHGKDPREFYYPKIGRMKAVSAQRDTLGIGIFGSSVTATSYITGCIREKAQAAFGLPVDVYNLSLIGGSTGDAAFMYKWLDTRRFHAVVVHGGIGEMRLNRRLREVHTNYSNLTWFRRRLDVEMYYSPYFKLPCALAYIRTSRMEKRGEIYTQWNYETDEGFPIDDSTRNVGMSSYKWAYQGILDAARERGEAVFAVAVTYYDSLADANLRRLAEEYNDTMNVMTERAGAHFVDISGLIDRAGIYRDFYHFNQDGQEILCECIVRKMAEAGIPGLHR